MCIVAGLLAGACSDTADTGETVVPSSSPTTSAAGGAVTVTSDVRFADAAPDLTRWADPLLDVYAPSGAGDLPLVVLFPPHGLTKDESPASTQLATAIAERGAVVVVANWSQLDDPPATFTDPAALGEITAAGQSLAGCAVSFAVSRAGDFGADPSRLVLVGELFGANTAGMVALGGPAAYPGCAATSAEWSPTGLVGVNGDWLATYPPLDGVAAAAVDAESPWGLLDTAPPVRSALVVTDAGLAASGRCDDRDATWMVARDPSGAMRDRLDSVGAYDDGCVDLGDEAEAMAAEMSAKGLLAEVVRLTNPDGATSSDSGAHVQVWGPADLTLLGDTVMAVARGDAS